MPVLFSYKPINSIRASHLGISPCLFAPIEIASPLVSSTSQANVAERNYLCQLCLHCAANSDNSYRGRLKGAHGVGAKLIFVQAKMDPQRSYVGILSRRVLKGRFPEDHTVFTSFGIFVRWCYKTVRPFITWAFLINPSLAQRGRVSLPV